MTREELNQDKQQEIIDEQNHDKVKKITLFVFKAIIVIVLLFILFYLYTTFVSTSRLIVKEQRVIDNKLPANFDGMKIIHFSDLHYGTTVFSQEIEKVVEEINIRKPDLVVFTGDLIDAKYHLKTDEQEELSFLLGKINAKLGKYAVAGEEDGELFTTIMKQSGFVILDNSYDFIYNGNDTPILLTGLGSYLNDNSDISKAFKYFSEPTHNSKIYTIALTHEPDVAQNIVNKYSPGLILAGHSHNGNVRIPYFGALYKFEGAKDFDQAYYKINDSELYISSGIGTNGPGFRLFCRPSINFFRFSVK